MLKLFKNFFLEKIFERGCITTFSFISPDIPKLSQIKKNVFVAAVIPSESCTIQKTTNASRTAINDSRMEEKRGRSSKKKREGKLQGIFSYESTLPTEPTLTRHDQFRYVFSNARIYFDKLLGYEEKLRISKSSTEEKFKKYIRLSIDKRICTRRAKINSASRYARNSFVEKNEMKRKKRGACQTKSSKQIRLHRVQKP